MVLFTTKFFRKLFYSKFSSIYVNKIVKLLMRQQSDDNLERRDDDLRGNSVLFIERMGRYDGLSTMYKVPKSGTTIDYWAASFPDKGFIGGWWIFDEMNHNYNKGGVGYGLVRDKSYFDRHARVYGNPCIVSGGPGLTFPWRTSDYVPSLVTRQENQEVCYKVTDHADFRVGSQSFSYAFWIYPFEFGNSNRFTQEVIKLDGEDDYIEFPANTGEWSQTMAIFSMSFWFKPTDDPFSQNYRNILSVGITGSQGLLSMYYHNGVLGVDVSRNNYGDSVTVETTACNTINKWYHIVVTFNSASGVKLYVNKVLVDSASYAFSIPFSATSKIMAGRWYDDELGEFHMAFEMKGFFWSDTTEYSQASINALYAGNNGSATGITETFHFFEGEGVTTKSTAGFAANLLNGAYWNHSLDYPAKGADVEQLIISKTDDANNGYSFWLEPDGRFNVQVREGGTDIRARMTAILTLNTWVHVVVTYDTSTNTIKIYRDKTDVTTTTGNTTPYNDPELDFNLWFLSNNEKMGCFKGALYEIIFEKGGAMNQTEVNNIYDNKSAAMGNNPSTEIPAWVNYAIAQ